MSHKTASAWLDALERLYAIFRLSPFGPPSLRAIRKDRKHYHFDWTVVPGDAARFENLVACHLLKWVHFRQDAEGLDCDLRYFRDRDGRETDFVVVERGAPALLVECKWSDAGVDRSLKYLKARFPEARAWQISASGHKDYVSPREYGWPRRWSCSPSWCEGRARTRQAGPARAGRTAGRPGGANRGSTSNSCCGCEDDRGERHTESVNSRMGGKIVASAVFLDFGIVDSVTDKHREYPEQIILQICDG